VNSTGFGNHVWSQRRLGQRPQRRLLRRERRRDPALGRRRRSSSGLGKRSPRRLCCGSGRCNRAFQGRRRFLASAVLGDRGVGQRRRGQLTRFLARELTTAHWFNTGAARRDLGYKPKISITEGLRRLCPLPTAGLSPIRKADGKATALFGKILVIGSTVSYPFREGAGAGGLWCAAAARQTVLFLRRGSCDGRAPLSQCVEDCSPADLRRLTKPVAAYISPRRNHSSK
jgi:hypothetical protein